MIIRRLFGCAAAVTLLGILASAQTAPKQDKLKAPAPSDSKAGPKGTASQELAAIRKTSADFVEAINAGNAEKVATHWTPDGDYVDETGNTISGRDAIQKTYAEFFAAHPGTKIELAIDSLRLLSDSAAIEDGRVILKPALTGAGSTKYLAVHVKTGDKWLMSSVRDALDQSQDAKLPVNDLEWLIGSWAAEENGSEMESVCSWVANKRFVERKYTVKHPDGTVDSGVQFIGWNPDVGGGPKVQRPAGEKAG